MAALLIASTSCTTPARRTEIGTAARVGPAKQPCPPPNDPAIQSLLRDDPLAFLEDCLVHYRKNIRDYHGVFSRQEILSDGLSKRQTMEITFREEPFSVDMRWIENPGRASRVSYVRDRWRQGGTQFALVHLRGLLAAIIPAGVKLDIHGHEMTSESRRPIDHFGLYNTLKIIIEHGRALCHDPDYEIRYAGSVMLNDLCCYLLQRHLPYDDDNERYPSRLLNLYIDQEWLVPIGCYSYSDEAGRDLISSYCYSNLVFNTGATDRAFE